MKEIVNLETPVRSGGFICLTPKRRDKIGIWPTTNDATDMRVFLRAINTTIQ